MANACSAEAMRCKSATAAGLCTWVINAIAYYDLAAPQQPEPSEGPKPEATSTLPISKADLTELKAFGAPPAGVIEVVAAVGLLLGREEKLDWKHCQRMLGE